MTKKIGIIGFGNMGSAIAEKIKDNYPVYCFDLDKSKTVDISGVTVSHNVSGLVNDAQVMILCVKPQDFKNTLIEIKALQHLADKLFISIAAGITTGYIQDSLGVVRVIRVMPNMASKIGQGISCLSQGKYAALDDLDFAQDLFEYLGETLIIEESQMNAATAVSGSGPGFLYYQIENKQADQIIKVAGDFSVSLSLAAQQAGFSREIAKLLAETTVKGSLAYLEKMKLIPSEAKKQVASKGGTTEAGLEVLQKGGTLTDAVNAAIRRAEDLSKKE